MIADIGMTALLPLLLSYSLTGELPHEIMGIIMMGLFVFHHVLNRGWFRSLFKGKYNGVRIINTVLDLLLILIMVDMMVSGIMISKHVFVGLGISKGTAIARIMHMLGAYWGLVLMSLHLGFHVNVMGRRMGIFKKKPLLAVLRVVFIAVSAYGKCRKR